MTSLNNRTNIYRPVCGRRQLWLMPCAILAMGLLLTGCLDFFGNRDRPQQPPEFELKPRSMNFRWGESIYIGLYFTEPFEWVIDRVPAGSAARFKVSIDGREENCTGAFPQGNLGLWLFFEDDYSAELTAAYKDKKEAYDVEIVYTADPTNPIEYYSVNTPRPQRKILNSFTFQQTVGCRYSIIGD